MQELRDNIMVAEEVKADPECAGSITSNARDSLECYNCSRMFSCDKPKKQDCGSKEVVENLGGPSKSCRYAFHHYFGKLVSAGCNLENVSTCRESTDPNEPNVGIECFCQTSLCNAAERPPSLNGCHRDHATGCEPNDINGRNCFCKTSLCNNIWAHPVYLVVSAGCNLENVSTCRESTDPNEPNVGIECFCQTSLCNAAERPPSLNDAGSSSCDFRVYRKLPCVIMQPDVNPMISMEGTASAKRRCVITYGPIPFIWGYTFFAVAPLT
ncbi:unnamed protein product, partial [Cyprideis torosa]